MGRAAASPTQQSVIGKVATAVTIATILFFLFDLAVPRGTTGSTPSVQLQAFNTERSADLKKTLAAVKSELKEIEAIKHELATEGQTLEGQQGHAELQQAGQQSSLATFGTRMEAEEGEGYAIFQPVYHDLKLQQVPQLLAPPESWLPSLEEKLQALDGLTMRRGDGDDNRSLRQRARAVYVQMIIQHVTGLVYGKEERTVEPHTQVEKNEAKPLEVERRKTGMDWTYLGETMTGMARLNNVEALVNDVLARKVPGDYIETGVWRGGSSILARAIIRSHDEGKRRSFVCDSFHGLPPGERNLPKDGSDSTWDHTPYLEVSAETVARSFKQLGVMDDNVIFAKGFFNETMPPLARHVSELALMRLDGDMYESTVDVLYHLYDKLSVGGYVIMDDWEGFPSRVACLDFFSSHGINPTIEKIDNMAVYWKKTEQVKIQKWRYEQSRFKPEDKPMTTEELEEQRKRKAQEKEESKKARSRLRR